MSSSPEKVEPPKISEEQMEKEQQQAREELDLMLKSTNPKNFREGARRGFNNVLAGALGGVGVAVLAPTVGAGMGYERAGVLGGVVGFTGGAVVGAVGAVGLLAGGAIAGATNVVRGIAAVPAQYNALKQGKWWNEATGEWILTDLPKESVPDNDDDILKKIQDDLDGKAHHSSTGSVKDTFYYDVLEVDPAADASTIKRRYYVLARKFHPDKVGADEKAAAEAKFKNVAEAYQVLIDPKRRKTYDEKGREGLKETETQDGGQSVDPALLFSFLFGSDKFKDYVGRLAKATSAMIGDSEQLSYKEARLIQQRRCTRLAKKLATKLEMWVAGEVETCQLIWKDEAATLSTYSYGLELVRTIGMIYQVTAVQFLGSTESGLGMPSISKWAQAQKARREKNRAKNKTRGETFSAGIEMMKLQSEFEEKLQAAQTDEERAQLRAAMEEAGSAAMLKVLWTTTVVDITSTLHETCQMVFYDASVDKETRKLRARGVKALGEIFQDCPEPANTQNQQQSSSAKKSAKTLYEEAAFAAMLETMKQKDESKYNASFRFPTAGGSSEK